MVWGEACLSMFSPPPARPLKTSKKSIKTQSFDRFHQWREIARK